MSCGLIRGFCFAAQTTSNTGEAVTFVLCTLTKDKTEFCSLNLELLETATLKLVEGKGPIHVTGSISLLVDLEGGMDGDDYDDEEGDDDDEDDDDEEGDDDDDEGDDDDESDDDDDAESDSGEPSPKKTKRDVQLAVLSKKALAAYPNSAEEEADLIANYNKCGGHWGTILHFQLGSDESDLPRYKFIIAKALKQGKAKTFSPQQQGRLRTREEEVRDQLRRREY